MVGCCLVAVAAVAGCGGRRGGCGGNGLVAAVVVEMYAVAAVAVVAVVTLACSVAPLEVSTSVGFADNRRAALQSPLQEGLVIGPCV